LPFELSYIVYIWIKKMKSLLNNDPLCRRDFIRQCFTCTIGFGALAGGPFTARLLADDKRLPHKALYWKPLAGKGAECQLCPNQCELYPGDTGRCHARQNNDGSLKSLVYSKASVIALDYIEKTPLYHYRVEGKVFSIATAGCNLACVFCQNYEVSQVGPEAAPKKFSLDPEEVIKRAKKHGSKAINFFYTEPVVYYEYMKDIALLAKKQGMKTFCITAGYINRKPLEELISLIDAFAVGLKGFTNQFYEKYIGGTLEPVKETLRILAAHREKAWFEIVNLVIPGLNDSSGTLEKMCRWIARDIGRDVPLHFTRYEPFYKLKDIPATPVSTLKRAHAIAKKSGLQYVYLGNVPGLEAAHTYCPKCRKRVIERVNFMVMKDSLQNGRCPCGHRLPGHW
jgi:pyruvate formate lyase activating enzyme